MSTVLVVEDEQAISEVVELALTGAGFSVRLATTVAEARPHLDDPTLDLVVLDLMLPDGDGVDLCRDIRSRGTLPVIMVTARDAEADRVLGLELGADDYITKPFSPRELAARVKAVLRRADRPDVKADAVVTVGGLTVDPSARTVSVGGEEIDLTMKEFDLLAHLVREPGRVFSRAQLLEAVWGYPGGIDSRTVDVHIAQLRRKLGDASPIRTVRGVGYKAT